MKPGSMVRMNAACKRALFAAGCYAHVIEFARCVGEVRGLVDYGNGSYGPELDVFWAPSGLRYAYDPEHLQLVAPKAWVVSDGDEQEHAVLTYAYTRTQARLLGSDVSDFSFAEAHARRFQEHDDRAQVVGVGTENDAAFLREQGWHREGERSCDTCGLSAYSFDEHAVCDECFQCPKCRDAEDCACGADT